MVDLYVVRRGDARGYQALQLRRTREPLARTWQPVMGHALAGERATQTVAREAREEIGLDLVALASAGRVWQLEQVHPFYIAAIDCVVLSPRFLALVEPGWGPTLNHEHDASRWVGLDDADRHFTWPGQLAALREIERILAPGSLQGRHLALTDPRVFASGSAC